METNIRHLIDFAKVDTLLEGFNKSTGFVTAIIDLEGNVISKSGWRQMCTEFHRTNPETLKSCIISDTVLANKMVDGEKYHFYKCLNGLVDVAVPIIINGNHIANLFSGQFFFEEPDISFFKKQANQFGFDEEKYLNALKKIPIFSEEKVKTVMDFLLNMTQMISEMSFQKLEQIDLNKALKESEEKFSKSFINSPDSIIINRLDDGKIVSVNNGFRKIMGYEEAEVIGKTTTELNFYKNPNKRNAIINALITTGQVLDIECWFITKHGEEKLALLSAAIIVIDGLKHIISTSRDITERKNAEQLLHEKNEKIENQNREYQQINEELNQINQELQKAKEKTEESENRYSELLNNLETGVVVHANDSSIIQCNEHSSIVLGLSEDQMKGKVAIDPYWKFINEDYTPIPSDEYPVMQIINHKKAIKNQILGVCKSEKEFVWVTINGFPVFNKKGDLKEIVISFNNITERKNAEENLRKSEAIKNTMVSNIGDVIVIIDENGNNKYKSSNITKLFGWTPEELRGKSTWDNIHPDDLEEGQKFIATIATVPNATGTTELRYKRKDGEYVWIEISVINLMHDKDIHGLLGNYHEITKRKQAEILIKDYTNRLELTMESASMAWWELNIQTGKVIFSRKQTDRIGYSPEQFQHYTDFTKLVHPDDYESMMLSMKALLEEKETKYDIEYRIKAHSGEYIWFHDIGTITGRTKNEEPLTVSGVVLNITERKLAEQEIIAAKEKAEESEAKQHILFEKLKQERILLRTIIDSVPDSIYVKDIESRKILANEANFQSVDFEKEEDIIGKTDFDIFPVNIAEKFFEDDQKIFSQGISVINREEYFIKPNGDFKWILTSKLPLYDDAKKIVGLVGIGRDITDRKKAEEAIKAKMDELERFQKLTVGRELTMIELKKEVNKLLNKLGEENKYKIVD
jgi:PAS domain S-box-containing protein